MSYTNFDKGALSGAVPGYRLGVYIYMPQYSGDNPNGAYAWYDINKPVQAQANDSGWGRVHESDYPTIRVKPQSKNPNSFQFSSFTMKLRNDDDMFSKDPLDYKFYNVGSTLYGKVATWYRQKIKLTIKYNEGGSEQEQTLGVFRLKDEPAVDGGDKAVITLIDVASVLADSKAADLKRGDTWSTNIPIPDAVRQVVEEGTRGELELESTYFQDEITTTSSNRRLSISGTVPLRDSSGDRVDSTDFVVRHMQIDYDYGYFAGYDKGSNHAAVAVWNRATGAWNYQTFFEGGEFVFVAHSANYSSYFYVVYISNKSPNWDSTKTYKNHLMTIYKLNRTGTIGTQASGGQEAYMMNQMIHMPFLVSDYYPTYRYYYGYGSFGGIDYDHLNISCPIDCVMNAPRYDKKDADYWHSYHSSRDTPDPSGISYPRSVVDVRTELPLVPLPDVEFWWGEKIDKGYTGALITDSSDSMFTTTEVRTYAHGAMHENFRFDPVRDMIYYVRWDPTNSQWYLDRYDMSSDTVLHQQIGIGGQSNFRKFYDRNITAFDIYALTGSTGKAWFAWESHYDGDDQVLWPEQMGLYEFNLTASGNLSGYTDKTSSFDSTHTDYKDPASYYNRYAPSIRSIRHRVDPVTLGYPLMGSVVNRYAASGHCHGFWFLQSAGSDQGIFVSENNDSYPISTQPFEISSASSYVADESTENYWLAQDQATGNVWEIKVDYSNAIAPTFSIISSGNPVDGENVWSSSNISVLKNPENTDTRDYEAFGVSASGPPADTQTAVKSVNEWNNLGRKPELGFNTPQGRQSLWRYSYDVSDVLPIADYGDEATLQKALEMLRQVAGDYIVYTDKEGKVAFREIPTSEPTWYIKDLNQEALTTNEDIRANKITAKKDVQNIVNSFKINAWIGERAATDVELILTPKSTALSVAGTIQAHQTTTASSRVILRVIRSGFPHDNYDSYEYGPLLMSWASVYNDLTTSASQALSTTYNWASIYGIYKGQDGEARLGDTTIKVGDTMQVGDGNIVEIASINTDDSFVTFVSGQTVGGSSTHQIGTTVTVFPRDDRTGSDSIHGITTTTAEFTPGPGARTLYVSSTKGIQPGMVLFRDTGYQEVISVVEETPDRPAFVKVQGTTLGTGNGQDSWPIGTTLNAALWIKYCGKSYAIGETGVTITFMPRSTDDVYNYGKFAEGDRIIIDSPGLQLKELKNSIFRSQNASSIDRWGMREWKPATKPRLLDPNRAVAFLDNLEAWKDPRWIGTAHACPLVPSVGIGDLFYVSNPAIWDTAVACYVSGYTLYLKSRQMEIDYRSTAGVERSDSLEVGPGGTSGAPSEKHDKHRRHR